MPEIMGVPGEIVLVFIAIAMIAIQFFTCWKWGNPLIGLIPTAVCIICVITFFLFFVSSNEQTFEDWWITLLCSIVALGADGLGWLTWIIWNAVRNGGPSNPAGY
jgi:hypothetical protein